MQKVNIHEAKTRLSAILSEIEQKGETFLICRNGKPIAELTPRKSAERLKLHPVLRQVKINYDPVEVLSDEEWGDME
jgi:antitoxin (DNA-binding transcriptional repressor) of toxin-antitoxin stability system